LYVLIFLFDDDVTTGRVQYPYAWYVKKLWMVGWWVVSVTLEVSDPDCGKDDVLEKMIKRGSCS